jgi:hypothetical protein
MARETESLIEQSEKSLAKGLKSLTDYRFKHAQAHILASIASSLIVIAKK